MHITDIPYAILRLQYRIARRPLQLFEDRWVSRLNAEAPARLLYERSIGSLDAAAGRTLKDEELFRRGAAVAQRSATLGRAVQLDAEADVQAEQASGELRQARDSAVSEQERARDQRQQDEQNAREAAAQRKKDAADTAADRTEAVKEQAQRTAQNRTRAAEAQEQRTDKRIDAVEGGAMAAAQSQLEDAADKRTAAQGKRSHAEDVENLADVEKAKRRGTDNGQSG